MWRNWEQFRQIAIHLRSLCIRRKFSNFRYVGLRFALLHENKPLIEMLRNSGLSINEPPDREWEQTLLHNAALFGDSKLVQFLLEQGTDR